MQDYDRYVLGEQQRERVHFALAFWGAEVEKRLKKDIEVGAEGLEMLGFLEELNGTEDVWGLLHIFSPAAVRERREAEREARRRAEAERLAQGTLFGESAGHDGPPIGPGLAGALEVILPPLSGPAAQVDALADEIEEARAADGWDEGPDAWRGEPQVGLRERTRPVALPGDRAAILLCAVHTAVFRAAGAEERWENRIAAGLTDAELRDAIEVELMPEGVLEGGPESYTWTEAVKGGDGVEEYTTAAAQATPTLRVWLKVPGRKRWQLERDELVAAVRRLLEVPQEAVQEAEVTAGGSR